MSRLIKRWFADLWQSGLNSGNINNTMPVSSYFDDRRDSFDILGGFNSIKSTIRNPKLGHRHDLDI